MSGDLDALIGQTLQDSGLAEMDEMGELVGTDGGDEHPQPESEGEETPVGEDVPAEGEGDPAEKPVEEKKETPEEGDELDRELQGLGLKGRDEKGQETRIRYSKIRRIWTNYKTKYAEELKAQHAAELTPLQTQVQQTQELLGNYTAMETMLQQDPARFIQELALRVPAIRQFVAAPGATPQGQTAAPAEKDDPRPEPNAVFPDGTQGYDLKGMQALEAWNARQVERRIEQRMQERFGKPLEDITAERRQLAEQRMFQDRITNDVETAKRIYGQVFLEDFGVLGNINPNSAVVAMMKANPTMRFAEACAAALVPKVQADRNKMRESILAEIDTAGKNRQSAARPAPARGVIPAKSGAQSTEDIIADEMRRAGLLP